MYHVYTCSILLSSESCTRYFSNAAYQVSESNCKKNFQGQPSDQISDCSFSCQCTPILPLKNEKINTKSYTQLYIALYSRFSYYLIGINFNTPTSHLYERMKSYTNSLYIVPTVV